MAGLQFVAQSDEIATGTTKKTILQLVAPSQQRVKVLEWSISFQGVTNTDLPIQVELARQSDAGTASALSLVKMNADDSETIQSTAYHTATVEPTEVEVVARENVHPQGSFCYMSPYAREIIISGGDILAIVVTSSVSVNAVARMVCEE